ncbi:MAG: GntR family transcriptional regulator [Christensenellaceae bacterium]
MSDIKHSTLSDTVFNQLEKDILSSKYKKGDLLTEIGLSKALNVSRTPVREAIRRLEQENLLIETPKGHVVSGLEFSDVIDIYDIRLKIEGIATARCALHADAQVIKQLKDVLDLQEFYTLKGEAEKIQSADSDFHEIIYRNCHSDIYSSILMSLHRKVQYTRRFSLAVSDRANCAQQEHKQIFLAIKNHDEALAEKLAIEHIDNAKNSIMRLNK